MGKALYDGAARARELFHLADEALGFSLSKICFEGPAEELTRTAIAQPAILTVTTICFELAQQGSPGGLPIVAAAGHSLGEYSALVAAGAIPFHDAVRLVNRRGTFMQEAVAPGVGAMVAVMGASEVELEQHCHTVTQEIGEPVELANVNTNEQIVVAGTKRAVDALIPRLAAFRTVPLQVSAPFHCSLMKPAAERLREALREVPIEKPRFPIFANFSASIGKTADEIRELLYQQVCGRVRWVGCMESARRQFPADTVIEFGNGSVLTGLMKRIDSSVQRRNVDSLESIEQLLKDSAV
jgi:[acyl-carrier-protein] S-malonyltransferase